MDITRAERTVLSLRGYEQDDQPSLRLRARGDIFAEHMERLEVFVDRDSRQANIYREVSRPDHDDPEGGRLIVEDDHGDMYRVYDTVCWFNGGYLFIEGYEQGPEGRIVRVRWALT